jgi:hypothetical protein
MLQIPEALLGKMVRCSGCTTTFKAEQVGITGGDVDQTGANELVELHSAEEEAEVSNRSRSAKSDVAEDRPRRRKRRRSSATPFEKVEWPSFALLIVGYVGGGLSLLLILANIILNIISLAAGAGASPGPGKASGGYQAGSAVGAVCCGGFELAFTFIWSWLLIQASAAMSRLTNYGTAVTGCVAAMVPCSCGWIAGLPVGVWCLIVLMDQDVKQTFR